MSKTSELGLLAKKYIPGGAHTYSKGDDQWPEIAPKVISRGKGCYVWDADGNQFIDWSMGLTSVALGHANPEVNEACIKAMELGHNFQRVSETEVLAAQQFLTYLKDRGDMVKFSKNGSTVTTAAVKLARSYTRRNKVAICSEHPFFSYDDWFIGATKCNSGVPDAITQLTVKFSYNNIASVQKMFDENPGQIGALIVEPMKFEEPKDDFLNQVGALCRKNGTIFILDEMVTGFKWHNRGASEYFGAKADLYTWGKGMANGHSVCALTGPKEIMELGGIDHDKPKVFLASTTHGAEIPQLAAFMKVLEIFERDKPVEQAWKNGAKLRKGLNDVLQKHDMTDHVSFIGHDCLFAPIIRINGPHKPNVARTFLLQELVRRGQLFQGLFYPTMAHEAAAIQKTIDVWNDALPKFKDFLATGKRTDLIGEPTKPVFRAFNSCECLKEEDCKACYEKCKTMAPK